MEELPRSSSWLKDLIQIHLWVNKPLSLLFIEMRSKMAPPQDDRLWGPKAGARFQYISRHFWGIVSWTTSYWPSVLISSVRLILLHRRPKCHALRILLSSLDSPHCYSDSLRAIWSRCPDLHSSSFLSPSILSQSKVDRSSELASYCSMRVI